MASSSTTTLIALAPYLSTVFIPVLAAIFSLVGSLGGGFIVWKLTDRSEKYKKLYGPLRFHLLMMKLIVENREEVLEDIKEWGDAQTRIRLMREHMSPLTRSWIEHCVKIRVLFEENAGLVKKGDFNLVADFMDGMVKREITEQGQNTFALRDNRTTKLLEAVKGFQNKLL